MNDKPIQPSDGGVAEEPAASKRPVAFRVIGENGGQVLFHNEDAAQEYAERNRVDYQGLYVRDGSALPPVPGNEGHALQAIHDLLSNGERPTVTEQNAFKHYDILNKLLVQVRGIAAGALSHSRSKCGGGK